MEEISKLFEGLATLLWPVIIIVLILFFRKSIQGLIESGRFRKWTFKLGEMEVSMDDLSKQQNRVIDDLMTELNKIKTEFDALKQSISKKPSGELAFERKSIGTERGKINSILWVDDKPSNNAFLIDRLAKLDVQVITVVSTKEAVKRFQIEKYDCVVSDLGRQEDAGFNPFAGFDLARSIREINKQIPIFIFSNRKDEELKQQAKEFGVTEITSSPSHLILLLGY